nr:protein mono-ADP-ribosyltransferase PARP3 isoform X3 [Chrysemys picta bellii]
MAPKRKAPAKAQAQDKKVKQEPEEDSVRSTVEALKTAPKEKLKAKIDSACQLSNGSDAQIHEDYDCMLNQTNIGNNNNKFYIIQLIAHNGSYSCWNRWGRVGEVGQSKLSPFPSLEAAKKDFEKKFREKTKNSWAERENFVAHPGKYTLIEVQHGAEEEQEVTVKVDSVDGGKRSKQRTLPCSLDKATQELVSLIFSNDMFKEAMQTMNIDVKKMPLGKLSKQQIAKGFEALEAIETALQEQPLSSRQLEELSSRFYTIIPHSFGRARPPTINTQEIVQAKKDMLLVLADIELAQSLQAQKKEEEEEEVRVEEVPHPLDKDYELLKCDPDLRREDWVEPPEGQDPEHLEGEEGGRGRSRQPALVGAAEGVRPAPGLSAWLMSAARNWCWQRAKGASGSLGRGRRLQGLGASAALRPLRCLPQDSSGGSGYCSRCCPRLSCWLQGCGSSPFPQC